MKTITTLGLLLLVVTRVPAGQPRGQGETITIAITNATVVDVVSGGQQTGVTVVTKAGRIANIGPRIPVPSVAVRVDGTGSFLIPGLWDLHSHNQGQGAESMELYLANGVCPAGADAQEHRGFEAR